MFDAALASAGPCLVTGKLSMSRAVGRGLGALGGASQRACAGSQELDEDVGGAGEAAAARVYERDGAGWEDVARGDRAQAGISWGLGSQASDAGVAQAGRDEALQGEVVVGAVDDARRDSASSPRVLERGLMAPARPPGDDGGVVEQLGAGIVSQGDLAVVASQNHPGVFEQRNRLDAVVGLGVDGDRDVEFVLGECLDQAVVLAGLGYGAT